MRKETKRKIEREELKDHREMVYDNAIQGLIDTATGQSETPADPDYVRYRWQKLKRIQEGKSGIRTRTGLTAGEGL